jgi:ankyrin repeat protein
MYAAAANLVEAVNLLLTAKSKINQVDVDGNSALHYAYAFGSLMAASVLEANGANTSAYNAKDKRPFDIVGISDAVHSLYV